MSTDANLKIVQDAYDAFFRQDLEAFTASFTDDTEVWEAESLPYAGTYKGKAGFLALIDKVMAVWEGLDLTIDQIAAGGDRVIVYGQLKITGKKTGKTVTMPLAEMWHIVNGKTRRLEVLYGDTALVRQTAGLDVMEPA